VAARRADTSQLVLTRAPPGGLPSLVARAALAAFFGRAERIGVRADLKDLLRRLVFQDLGERAQELPAFPGELGAIAVEQEARLQEDDELLISLLEPDAAVRELVDERLGKLLTSRLSPLLLQLFLLV
jgi:hypothetical protein